MTREPVRVLSLVSSLCVGGAEKHAITLLNRLSTARFNLSLAYLKPEVSLLPQLDASRLRSVQCLDVRRKLDWRAIDALTQLIDREQSEVLLCTNEYPALYALLAARRARHKPQLVEVFHTTLYRMLKEKLQMQIYRHVFRRCALLVYVSGNQQQHWRNQGLGADRDIVIHNGIDCDRYENIWNAAERLSLRAGLGYSDEHYVVGICAALRPEKAHGDLLQAIAQLRIRVPFIRALIIGDGDERARLETLIDTLQLRDCVTITGYSPDVRPLLACCDAMVLTSHHIETFSIAALEAMAMAKPLVLTRIGGASEQVQDGINGYLYEPGDIRVLATHLLALTDRDLRHAMGQASLQMVRQRFTESAMIAAYSEQLENLAGN
jgi:glycosyltransferase involved in cell wall biosynthesis